jgi:hypothetical protein
MLPFAILEANGLMTLRMLLCFAGMRKVRMEPSLTHLLAPG